MKKILLIMICMFLLVGMVSATKMKYENEDMKVDFKKSFLGIGGADLGSVELKSHKSVTEIRKLSVGENQAVMFYDFKNWKKHKNGLGEVTFIDMNTGEIIEKDYYFAELVLEQQQKYKTKCKDKFSSNGTKYQECSQVKDGFKEVEVWKRLNDKDIPGKNARIGLITDVEVGDYIDAIWTIARKKVKKHASWTTDLNVDIKTYWKLNESSGTLFDSIGNINITGASGTPSYGQSGLIGTAVGTDGGSEGFSEDIGSASVIDFGTTEDFSTNMWVFFNGDSTGFPLILSSNALSDPRWTIFGDNANKKISWRTTTTGGGVTLLTDEELSGSEWNMITTVRNNSGADYYLYINGVLNKTSLSNPVQNASSGTLTIGNPGIARTFNGNIDEVGVWGRVLSQSEITQLYNGADGITWFPDSALNVILNSPANNFFSSNSTIIFNATITTGSNPDNVSLIIDDVYNETNTSGILGEYIFTKILSEGTHNWNVEECISGVCFNASSSNTFTIDSTFPTIDIESPIEIFDRLIQDQNITLNFTATDNNLDTCLLAYNNTNTTIPCTNATKTNTGFLYEPGFNNLTIYVNDSLGNINSSLRIWAVKIQENSRTFNETSFETQSETFKVDITANSSLTAVTLDYNGTDKIMTQSGTNWTTTFDIPEGVINRTFRFKYTYAGDSIFSDYFWQNISLTNFSICDAGLTTPFFNVSFQDENDLTAINASIPTSSFSYYLGSGTVAKNYTFVSGTEFANFTFCATPTTLNLSVDSRIQYKGTSYPQRTYNPLVTTYANTTTNKILYLLDVADGIYVTFQTINLAHEPIIGATVNATRVISDETVVVGDGITDASGSVTFWLNPDFQHAITFGKEGFPTTVFLVTPTQTSYTITIGATSTEDPDYTRGITRLTYPNQDFLDNATEYDFNFTLASVYWTVTEFGFTLTYQNGTIIKTTSSSSNGGTLSANNINVTFIQTNESHIDLDYYYIINETYINGSRTWEIVSTEGRQYSLWNFFTNLSLYINSGNLFGFDDFGRILLSVIILIMVAGGVSLKYGIRSDSFTMGVIFGLVVLLDFGLNFFPAIKIGSNLAINNFATFIVAIILIAVIIKEERN